jgi:hypothetical protein
MRTLQLATPLSLPSKVDTDPVDEAAYRLARSLGVREDAQVLVSFIEDELREGLAAIDGVQAHFTDVLDGLRGQLAPATLLEIGENAVVLEQLQALEDVVRQLKRRLGQAAAKLRER